MSSVLLPCPFCGSAAAMLRLTELPHDDPNWNGWYVECNNASCAATTNIHFGEAHKPLLDKWNRRAVDHTRRERDALERERIRLNPIADAEVEPFDWPERYERLEHDLRRFEEGYWCRGDPDELHYCTKCDKSVKPERYPIANYRAHEAIRVERDKLRRALVACVAVAKAWHGPDVWDIYYNHSPEMKPVREILGRVFACETCHDSGEVEAMTNHLGPDDYAITIACPDCSFPKDQGHGVPSA